MPSLALSTVPHLTDGQRAEVLALVAAATDADGTAPLSERFLLALRPGSGAEHTLAYAGSTFGGYAQVDEEAAELVVAPEQRRQGIGSALLQGIPDAVRIWAHGDLAAAEAFGRARGLAATRELYVLGRSLTGEPALERQVLPVGLRVRAFEPGRDEDEWLRANAAAFRSHPEQGRLTRVDLDARMAETWFDGSGFLLVVPQEDPGSIAAFHWTKVHPPDELGPGRTDRLRGGRDPGLGEVYVLGVDPAYQGRGLARPLTLLGLEHLRDKGLEEVILYVDGDNAPAMTVYRKLGFTTRALDRMYSRDVPPTVQR